MRKLLLAFLEKVPVVSPARNYWFIRTNSGKYYKPFLEDNVVAIGFNNISIADISRLKDKSDKEVTDSITEFVKRKHPEHGVPGLAASQLKRFFFEVKKGDFVVIPSAGTKEFAFGEITDDFPHAHTFANEDRKKDLSYSKSRFVQWHKRIPRHFINPNIFGLFMTHQAISSGNAYSEYLDSAYYPVYKKDDKLHFQLEITGNQGINGQNLFNLCSEMLDGTNDILDKLDIKEDTSDIEVKINLNSPGTISFIGKASFAIAFLCVLAVAISGGKYTGEFSGVSIDIHVNSVITKISEYKSDRHREKMISDIIKSVKTDNQVELLRILQKPGG